jgi:hypothetical protein
VNLEPEGGSRAVRAKPFRNLLGGRGVDKNIDKITTIAKIVI